MRQASSARRAPPPSRGSHLFSAGGRSSPTSSSTGLHGGINGCLGHIGDIFSIFSKHIAPTYHHDRPERSVQMRLYTMHKGQHLLIFIMFLSLFFIALLMGMAGPSIITTYEESAAKLVRDANNASVGGEKVKSQIPAGPFLMVTPGLETYRQQMWISSKLITQERDSESFTKRCTVNLRVEGMTGKRERALVGGAAHNRTRTINCDARSCASFIVMHLGVLEYPRYLINVSFAGLESVDRHFNIVDIVFTVITYNPDFTRMELWFRLFFVAATAVVGILFLVAGMKNFVNLDEWSIEQKWVAVLLPLLLAFDDPIFPMTLTSSSLFPAVVDAVFQATFLFALLLFWLCILHGLRQTERGFYRFYLPKLMLVGSMWSSALTIAVLEITNELRDPSFSYQLNVAHYERFQIFFASAAATYVVYLLYLGLRAFGELRAMNFLDSRLKFHATSLLVALFLTLSIVLNRYGSGTLEDNLVAKLYTSYDSEAQFLAFYTVLNCYVYVLAYVYSPTSAQTRDHASHLLKDNPAFSMINESDDETEAMLVKVDEERGGMDDDDDDEDDTEVDTAFMSRSGLQSGRKNRGSSSGGSAKDDASALLLGQDD